MIPALLVLGALAVWYYATQQNADAPCHCCSATEENSSVPERLSFAALVQLAQNAGFGADSQTAAAIAMAESGGDPNAYNPEPQDVPGKYDRVSADDGLGSYGLWQIYAAAHPEFNGQDLTDPDTNAGAAFQTYTNSSGFRAWSTFKSGAYQKYLQA